MTVQEMIAKVIETGTDEQFIQMCVEARKAGASNAEVDDLVFHRNFLHNPQFAEFVRNASREVLNA